MANIKLRVTGMTCGHCQAKVEKALKGVSGVYSAIIDLPDGEAEVDFDDDSVTHGPARGGSHPGGLRREDRRLVGAAHDVRRFDEPVHFREKPLGELVELRFSHLIGRSLHNV